MQDSVIHLAMCFDQNYVDPFYVLLTSIFLNNERQIIHIHVIATGLSDSQKAEMQDFAGRYEGQIFFYTISEEDTAGLQIPEGTYFTVANYYRLFIPRLVPDNIHNILYLDTDIIVTNSLVELCAMELGEFPVAAALDTEMWTRVDLGIEPKDYFNSGVMLINLAKWREQRISERSIQFAREFIGTLNYVDQDALNGILHGYWHRLPVRYNLMRFDVPLLSKKEMLVFLKDKVIIHYNGTKPWKYECDHLLRNLYHYYHKNSPCSNNGVYLNFKPNLKAFKLLAKNYVRDTYFGYPIFSNSWRMVKLTLGR